MSNLRLRLFGTPRFESNGGEIAFGRRKAMALIAYLAMTQQPQSRERLLGLFWPDFDPPSARNNLRRELSLLNAVLGGDVLRADRTVVMLADDLDVDTVTFLRAVREAGVDRRVSPILSAPLADALDAAVALYTDDFLAGFSLPDSAAFEEWQFLERESLRRQLGNALAALVGWRTERGELDRTIALAQRWVALDPLHEAAQRALMRAYALDGQHAAALRQYELAAQQLDAELGATPEAETTALIAAIRARQLPRLARQTSPEQGTSTSTLQPVIHAPMPTTSFVGRVAELAEIAELLARPGCRLVTLLGPGGSGKTRLALEAAQRISDRFADGVYFVALHNLASPDQLAGAIADALGLVSGQTHPEAALTGFLQQRHVLLVLDNFEAVIDGADLIGRLLAVGAHLCCLVTTRELLNLQEEWVYPVEGLEQAVLIAGSQPDESAESMQLFAERARRVRRDFDLPRDLVDVARICRLVDGLPLALELAAAWTKTLSCAEIAEAVQRDIDILTGTARNLPERHRSMRAVLEASWRRLSADESAVFAALAIFESGFRAAAAATVAGATNEHLAAFVDKAMLQRSPDGRFQMHTMLRAYALEQLARSSAQRAASESAHARYFVDFLRKQQPAIKGEDQRRAVAAIDAEYADVRSAWLRQLRHPDDVPLALAADALLYYLEMRSHFNEGADLMAQSIHLLQEAKSFAGRAALLGQVSCYLGWFALRLGDLERVEAAFQAAQGYYAEAGIPHAGQTGADPLVGLGTLANTRGQFAEAARLGEIARQQSESTGDKGNLADAHYVLISAAYGQGDYTTALHHARRAQTLLDEVGDHWMMGHVLANLGMIALALGDYRQAHAHFGALRTVREAFGDQEGVATALRLLADVARLAGDFGEATALYRHSLAILRRLDDRGGIAAALGGLGSTAWAEGRRSEAIVCYREALELARSIGYMPLTLQLLAHLGACCHEAGDPAQGRLLLALSLRHPAGSQEVKDLAARLLDRQRITLSPSDIEAALDQMTPAQFSILLADLFTRMEAFA